jgi:hypothetical protein
MGNPENGQNPSNGAAFSDVCSVKLTAPSPWFLGMYGTDGKVYGNRQSCTGAETKETGEPKAQKPSNDAA